MRRVSSRSQGQSGVVATEFVIILPLLVLLTFGTFGMARAWNVHNVMDHAAREAARYGATATWDETTKVEEVGQQVLAASWVGSGVAQMEVAFIEPSADDGCVDEQGAYAFAEAPGRVHVCVVAPDYPINLGFFTWEVTMRASAVSRFEGTLP